MSTRSILLRRSFPFLLILALALTGAAPVGAASVRVTNSQARTAASDQPLTKGQPLSFVENVGQFEAGARYQVNGAGGALWLSADALWLTVLNPSTQPALQPFSDPTVDTSDESQSGVNLKLTFAGANPHARLQAFNRLSTHISYLIGNQPVYWQTDVPVWGGVRYIDLYPGLDLELVGSAGHLQARLVARSEDYLQDVQLRVEGAASLQTTGNALRLKTAVGTADFPLLTVVHPDGSPVALTNAPRAVQVNIVAALFVSGPTALVAPQDDDSDLLLGTFLGGLWLLPIPSHWRMRL